MYTNQDNQQYNIDQQQLIKELEQVKDDIRFDKYTKLIFVLRQTVLNMLIGFAAGIWIVLFLSFFSHNKQQIVDLLTFIWLFVFIVWIIYLFFQQDKKSYYHQSRLVTSILGAEYHKLKLEWKVNMSKQDYIKINRQYYDYDKL